MYVPGCNALCSTGCTVPLSHNRGRILVRPQLCAAVKHTWLAGSFTADNYVPFHTKLLTDQLPSSCAILWGSGCRSTST